MSLLVLLKARVAPHATPCLLVGLYGYTAYAVGREVAHNLIYKRYHHRGTYLGVVCVYAVLASINLILWGQVKFRAEPGTFGPRQHLQQTEPYFHCDPQGYPLFCTACQGYKPLRVQHSSNYGSCIVKFDHFCLFLNAVIGYANLPIFIKLLFWFILHWLFVLVLGAVYLHRVFTIEGRVNIHLVALTVISAFWVMLTGALFLQTISQTLHNRTAVDERYLKLLVSLHLSVDYPTGRKVVRIDKALRSRLYDLQSPRANLELALYDSRPGPLFLSLAYLFVPLFDPAISGGDTLVTVDQHRNMRRVQPAPAMWETIQAMAALAPSDSSWDLMYPVTPSTPTKLEALGG